MLKRLLHYELTQLIGRGGMGDVYAAEDTKLGRKVALKILPAEMAADPERRARFEREAKAVAALNHPNIVTIHSVEEAEGVHFITMELVEGKTLSELTPKGGCQLGLLLDYAVAMTDAVSAAHRRGITHRDLKPDNVMVTGDGRVKVLDFGLAKLRGEEPDDAAVTRVGEDTQTAEGKILGTVAYMSPEQAEGKSVDARSDVFSLGIILYEMATGRRPFRGDTPVSTLSSILKDTPSSVTELNASLPRHLGRIVKRCLTKDPNRRYQTAVDLRNDLEGLKEEIDSGEILLEGGSSGPGGRRLNRKQVAVGLAVLVVAALTIGYGAYRLFGSDVNGLGAPSALQQMEMTRLTRTGDAGYESAISPDGKYVVYVKSEDGASGLWLLHVTTGRSVQIVPPSDAGLWGPAFSPDGDYIYYIGRASDDDVSTLYRVPVLGGPARLILDDVYAKITFSPDGSQFAFRRSDGIREDALLVADSDGANEREISSRVRPREYHGDIAWSPDGRVVAAITTQFDDAGGYHLVEIPSEGGAERRISSTTWAHIERLAWLPDGSGLVMQAYDESSPFQIWEHPYPEGSARRITNDLNAYSGVSLTADGKSLVTQLMESEEALWVTRSVATGEFERITPEGSSTWGVSWTPDGRLVYGATSDAGVDLWITAENGGEAERLTSDGASAYPSVSADGRYVVYRSRATDRPHVWRMDLDGGNPVQLTFGDGELAPQCHPDGRWVLYLGEAPDGHLLYKVPIEGGEPELLSDRILNIVTPAISPDGRLVAVEYYDESADDWRTEILEVEGGKSVRTLELVDSAYRRHLSWSPTGDALDYVVYEGGAGNIRSQPLNGGSYRQLSSFESEQIDDFAWAPDGTSLALTRRSNTWDVVLLSNFR